MAVSLSIIGDLLVQLLHTHNRVSLPGLGAFVTEYKPAAIIKNGKGMVPPEKTVAFRTSEFWNDGLLEKELAVRSAMSEEEAKKQIAHFVREMDILLREGKRVEFPEFGIMRITADGDYAFKKDDDINLLPDAFGLLELDVMPLPYEAPAPAPATPLPADPFPPPPPVTPYYPPPPAAPGQKPKRRKSCMVCWTLLTLLLLANLLLMARSILSFYAQEERDMKTLRTRTAAAPAVAPPAVKAEPPKPAAVQAPAEPPPPAPVAAPAKKKTTPKSSAPAKAQDTRKSKPMNLFHIMVGAYADEKTAKTAMQRLQDSAGCSCGLVNTGGQRPYKISSFRYATQKEADEILSVFKRTDPEYGSAWVERY
ncbi:MAG: hypothetical protein LBI89_03100 [Prevotellaceae bacterium]|jgi:nucleoid DNA-binding protein|nr:hypothetical protein [Prevotellaceae bacterium]